MVEVWGSQVNYRRQHTDRTPSSHWSIPAYDTGIAPRLPDSNIFSLMQGRVTYQNVVVRDHIGQSVFAIHFVGQDDFVFIVEGDIALVLLVEDI